MFFLKIIKEKKYCGPHFTHLFSINFASFRIMTQWITFNLKIMTYLNNYFYDKNNFINLSQHMWTSLRVWFSILIFNHSNPALKDATAHNSGHYRPPLKLPSSIYVCKRLYLMTIGLRTYQNFCFTRKSLQNSNEIISICLFILLFFFFFFFFF